MKVSMVRKVSPVFESSDIPCVILQYIESEIKEYNDQLIDNGNDDSDEDDDNNNNSDDDNDKNNNSDDYNDKNNNSDDDDNNNNGSEDDHECDCNGNDDKLKICDFVFVEWLIDGKTYYDICHFKYDAEVGTLFKSTDNDGIKEVCTIDKYRLIFPKKERDLRWCKKFEKQRIDIIEQN